MLNREAKFFLVAILIIGDVVSAPPATWVGAAGGPGSNMNVSTNWLSGSAPTSGTLLLFNYATPLNFTVNQNIINPYTFAVGSPSSSPSITLLPPSSAASYTLSGFSFVVPTGGGWITCGGGPTFLPNTFGCAISIPESETLTIYGNNGDIFSGAITGSGNLSLGGGALVLSGTNGYTGTTAIAGAGVTINTADAIYPTSVCTITSTAGTITLNADQKLTLNQSTTIPSTVVTNSNTFTIVNGQSVTWNGPIDYKIPPPTSGSGTGGTFILDTGSTGTLTLGTDSTYSYVGATASFIGNTTVNAGTLQATTSNGFGLQSNITVASGATLNYPASAYTASANSLIGAGTVNLQSSTGSVLNIYNGGTFSGTLTGAAQLIYWGTTPWILSNVTTGGGFTGNLTISGGGTVSLQGLPSSSTLTIKTAAGGVLQALGDFTIPTTTTLNITGGIDTNGHAVTVSGQITGAGTLLKKGANTLTLQGSNNYTGGTQVAKGTLVFSTANSFPTNHGPIVNNGTIDMSTSGLNNSTIFYLSGNEDTASLLLGSNIVTIYYGNGPSPIETLYAGTITGSGSLTVSDGTFTTSNADPFASFTGSLTLGGAASGMLVTDSFGGITALNFRTAGTSGVAIGEDCSFAHPVSINAAGQATVGSFYINDLVTLTISGNISSADSAGILQKDGPGTLILSGSNAGFIGVTSILDGVLQLDSATALSGTSKVALGSTGTLDLNGQSLTLRELTGLVSGDMSSSVEMASPGVLTITNGLSTAPFYGTISGTGALVLEGTLVAGEPEPQPSFFGTNTYTGTTTLTNGVYFNTEHLGASSQYNFTGTGGVVTILANDSTPTNDFNISANATATLSTNTYNLTLGGTITADDTATFAKIGEGTLTLTADNSSTFVGNLLIQGGVLNVTHESVGSPESIVFQQFCGTLQAADSMISLNPTSGIVMATTGIFDTGAFNVAIPGNIIYLHETGVAPPIGGGGLSKMGSGTLTLSGTNTYNGNTQIFEGEIVANQAAFPATTTDTATVITKQLIFDVTAGTGTFTASGPFTAFPRVIFFSSGTIDTNGNAVVINNIISGASTSTFTKDGMDTLTLSGANTYTGPTVVSAGTLQAGAASIFSGSTQTSGAFGIGSAISVPSGSTLDLNGHNNTIGKLSGAGDITLGAGVLTISNGNGNTFSGEFTNSGGGVVLSSGTLTLSGAVDTASAAVSSGATLILNGGTYALGAITNAGTLTPYDQITATTYTETGTLDVSNWTTFPMTGVINGSGAAALGGILVLPRIQPATSPQVILQYSSETGQFSSVKNLGSGSISYNATQTLWDFSGATSCQGIWDVAGTGAWETAMNWSPSSCAPGISNTGGVEDDVATFSNQMGEATITVSLNAVATLGALSMGASTDMMGDTAYTISNGGAGSIVMGGTGALNPEIQVYYGPHTIEVPISVADTLSIVSKTADADLTISGNMTLNSTILTVTNPIDSPTGLITISGNFVSPGGSVILNGGALELQGTSAAISNLTIQSGTLQMNTSSQPAQITFGGTGAGVWKAEAALTLTSTIALTEAGTISSNTFAVNSTGIISGSSGLTKVGTNTLTLSGANTYTGSTTVTAGTLQAGIVSTATTGPFGAGSAVTVGGSGTLALQGYNTTIGSLSGSGALTLGSGVLTITSGGGNTFSGTISQTGGITLLSGIQTLMATNSYTGTTTVSGGTLQAGASTSAFGSSSPIVLSGSGILSLNGYNQTVGSLTSSSTSSQILLGSNTLTIGASTGQIFQGLISGTGGLTKNGSGIQILSGANTYTGATTVTVGTLQAGVASVFSGSTQTSGAFGVGSNVTVSGGATLALSTFDTAIGSLSGAGTVNLGSAVLKVTDGGTYTGVFTGTGGVTLTSGTLVLSGASDYTGPTIISGGILQTGASTNVLGNGSAITVASGAELDFQSYAVTELGALVNGGTVTAANTINMTSFTQTSGGVLTLDINEGMAPFGFINSTGIIALDGTLNVTGGPITSTLTILSGTSRSGRFSIPPSGFTLEYSSKTVNPATVKLVTSNCTGVWISGASGDWDISSNWAGGCIPGFDTPEGDTANFDSVASTEVAIQLSNGSIAESPELLNLIFNTASTSYTISEFTTGGGEIILNPGSTEGTPTITVSAGSHTINTPIVGSAVDVSAVISITNGATLAFGSNVELDTLNILTITDVDGKGTFNNAGVLIPQSIVIEGNDVNNSGWMIAYTGNLTIQETANVVNTGLLSSNAAFAVTGGTLINNELILSDSVAISGGTTTNNTDISTNGFTFSGGTLINNSLITTTSFTETGSPQLTVGVLSPSSFGAITADTATVAGSLTVNALPGFAITGEQTLNLITSGADVTSRFANVSFQNFPGSIIPSLVYSSGLVQLSLVEVAPSHAVTSGTTTLFASVGQHNFMLMRQCLHLRGRLSEGRAPSETANLLVQAESPVQRRQELLTTRLVEPSKPWNVYAGPVASFGHVNPKGGQPGAGYYSAGVLAGADYAVKNKEERPFYVGFGSALEYRYKSGVLEQNDGVFKANKLHATLYTTIVPKSVEALAIDLMGGFAYQWDHLDRYTGPGKQQTAVGTPKEKVIDFLFDLEYTFSKKKYACMPENFAFIPLVDLQYIYAHLNGYKEAGAGIYDLQVSKQSPQSLSTLLGARANYQFKTSGSRFRFEVDGGWQREYLDHDRSVSYLAFNASSITSNLTAFGAGRNSWLLGFDFLATVREKVQIEASCDLKWNSLFFDAFFYLGVGGEF